jgi:hypothetical protein
MRRFQDTPMSRRGGRHAVAAVSQSGVDSATLSIGVKDQPFKRSCEKML